ncbi:MAG: hypothetical protein AAB390_01795 [Patescibacteria group bacterium]
MRSGVPVDALEIIRKCVVERLPKFEDLPAAVKIDSSMELCSEARDDFRHMDNEELSLLGVSDELRTLHDVEFSCAVVADHEGNLTLAPVVRGEKKRVGISAPLSRTEMTSPMGLIVYRDQTISACVHTHVSEYSFSLLDIYTQFTLGNGSIKQIYVVRGSGVIDMAHLTEDSSLLSRESFDRLAQLWDVYLDHEGMFRDGMSEGEYNDFIKRILNETLRIGFYSNEESGDPAILQKIESKK